MNRLNLSFIAQKGESSGWNSNKSAIVQAAQCLSEAVVFHGDILSLLDFFLFCPHKTARTMTLTSKALACCTGRLPKVALIKKNVSLIGAGLSAAYFIETIFWSR
jgi:hypothetical protein